jgi:hypothetical protein
MRSNQKSVSGFALVFGVFVGLVLIGAGLGPGAHRSDGLRISGAASARR